MLNKLRPALSRVLTPVGHALARTPLTPNAITIIGTIGVAAGALALFPGGHLFAGTVVCTVFVLFDMFDGALARVKGTSGKFGAFLDSTLDRVADAAIFSGLACYYVLQGPALTTGSWPGWRCSAWWPGPWCLTRRPAPRAWGCAATSASPSGPSAW